MSRLYKYFIIIFLMIGIPVSNFYFHTFSYGFFILALLIHIIYQIRISKKIFLCFLLLEFFILIQIFLTSGYSYKSLVSSVIIVYCAAIYFSFGDNLEKIKKELNVHVLLALVISVSMIAISSFLLKRFTSHYLLYDHPKPCFPFEEPSHFAIFLGPFIIFMLAYLDSALKWFLIVALFLLSVLLESVTFGVYTLVGAILYIRENFNLRSSVFFVILLISFYFFDVLINQRYMIERLSFVLEPKTINMTALVYLQGWESVLNTFKNHPLGLGFQFLGMETPNKYSVIIHELSGGYVNRQDGGFLFAKLYSEFGFFIPLFFIGFLFWFKRNYPLAHSRNSKGALSVFYVYIALLPALFIRDVGYFSYTFFYFTCASGYLYGLAKNVPYASKVTP